VAGRVFLRIDAGVDHGASVSRVLADELMAELVTDDDVVVQRDVSAGLPFVDPDWVAASFFGGDPAALALSDELVNELLAADELVLVAPVYNLGVPAALKAWIDQVVRAGRVFRFTEQGPEGMTSLQRAWIVTCSGGTPIGSPLDFNTSYLRAILGFVGVPEVRVVAPPELLHVEVVDVVEIDT
jgi:FMN-dependent NADH-azoreductase